MNNWLTINLIADTIFTNTFARFANTCKIKTKARYSFEDRGTDGRTDGIDFGMYPQRPLFTNTFACFANTHSNFSGRAPRRVDVFFEGAVEKEVLSRHELLAICNERYFNTSYLCYQWRARNKGGRARQRIYPLQVELIDR